MERVLQIIRDVYVCLSIGFVTSSPWYHRSSNGHHQNSITDKVYDTSHIIVCTRCQRQVLDMHDDIQNIAHF